MARFTEQLRQILHKYDNPGAADASISDVGRALCRSRATIHSHVQRLVELGYLKKVEYGRYLITPDGKRALESRPSARSFTRCPDCGRKITL